MVSRSNSEGLGPEIEQLPRSTERAWMMFAYWRTITGVAVDDPGWVEEMREEGKAAFDDEQE